jgi:hypothetical protein
MKFTSLALAPVLLLIPNGYRIGQQQPPAPPAVTREKFKELLELEAQLEKLDRETDPISIEVTGDDESSGKIKISAHREIETATTTPMSGNANTSGQKSKKAKTQKVPLLNIDLSKISVPDEYIREKIAAAFSNPSTRAGCPGVKVMKIEPGIDYQVVEDYTYRFGNHSITAWREFTYDRASIPRVFWVLIDKDSLSNVAPLFHDLLYRHEGELPNNRVSPYRKYTRKEADDLFYELMSRCGVSYPRRVAAYRAVRELAASSWKKR